MKYDGSKHKLNTIFQNENKNSSDSDLLQKIDLNVKPENILKVPKTITLIKSYNFAFEKISIPFDSRLSVIHGGPDRVGLPIDSTSLENMIFYIDMPNFPDWAIPFIKLTPKAYTDDGYDVTSYTTSELRTYFQHFWRYIGENQWKIWCSINARILTFNPTPHYVPFYIDLDLVIFNERVWEVINSYKQ